MVRGGRCLTDITDDGSPAIIDSSGCRWITSVGDVSNCSLFAVSRILDDSSKMELLPSLPSGDNHDAGGLSVDHFFNLSTCEMIGRLLLVF